MGAAHPPERIRDVRRLAAEGKSDREIGEQLALSKAAVEKIRRNHGILPGKTISVNPDALATIRLMASEGAPDSEIGQAVGMSKAAVWGVRKRHGVQKADVQYTSSRTDKKVVRPRQQHVHGTPSMYNSGCRCDDCRTANRERMRASRARMKERLESGKVEIEHGLSGYNNWGCRCDICVSEHAARCKRYDAQRRQNDPEGTKERDKARRLANWEAINSSNVRRVESYQAETLDQADRYGETWTSRELELVSQRDLTVKEVALALGRSYHAVRTQRTRMFAETSQPGEEKPSVVRTHGLGGYSQGCRCETCAEAKSKYRKAHGEKVQAETMPEAGNARKQWTGPELEMAAREDLSVKEIALRLGRSYAAVSVIRHKIRHDPKTINFAGIARGADDESAGPVRPDEETTP